MTMQISTVSAGYCTHTANSIAVHDERRNGKSKKGTRITGQHQGEDGRPGWVSTSHASQCVSGSCFPSFAIIAPLKLTTSLDGSEVFAFENLSTYSRLFTLLFSFFQEGRHSSQVSTGNSFQRKGGAASSSRAVSRVAIIVVFIDRIWSLRADLRKMGRK